LSYQAAKKGKGELAREAVEEEAEVEVVPAREEGADWAAEDPEAEVA
jgi:hypothetical protein